MAIIKEDLTYLEPITDAEAQAFIDSLQWTFAKSMPQWPHFWTVRRDAPDASMFDRLVGHIRRTGYPDTYERLTRRLAGIDMACKFGTDDFFQHSLPPVFGSWAEYRDYLLANLITKPEWRDAMRKKFDEQEAIFGPTERAEPMRKMHVNAVLRNDWECITPINWYFAHKQYIVRKRLAGKVTY